MRLSVNFDRFGSVFFNCMLMVETGWRWLFRSVNSK
jgi:hypothetical protein